MATVDKKHQVIVDAQAFGEGQEHHILQPVLDTVRNRFQRQGRDVSNTLITADTGYACEANMQYLHDNARNYFSHVDTGQ